MKALILAGGAGTRLWPASRETYPKQGLGEGNYFWNSGMFSFTVGTIDEQKDS
jgi:mannose-1-phosphate guanylyltransferase